MQRHYPSVVASKRCTKALPGSSSLHLLVGAVSNKQGFSYVFGKMQVMKLVRDSMLRLVKWNIGTVLGKEMELVNSF